MAVSGFAGDEGVAADGADVVADDGTDVVADDASSKNPNEIDELMMTVTDDVLFSPDFKPAGIGTEPGVYSGDIVCRPNQRCNAVSGFCEPGGPDETCVETTVSPFMCWDVLACP
jgi:hypothetical protein